MVANRFLGEPQVLQFSASEALENFIHNGGEGTSMLVYDTIAAQLKELYKITFPYKAFDVTHFEGWKIILLEGRAELAYGNWIYYPWENSLVHLLPEAAFIAVRTNRNNYKITPQEQQLLSQKKVGVVGLSVGQQVALTIAMERSAGEIRLADFDTIDLSNLNRLRCGVTELGLNKTISCAQQIWKIDPYIKLRLFVDGLTESTIDDFFTKDGKLDLLIEECDGLDVKILARDKAKIYGVPVLMETNDRCLIDIERFDLEPDRPLLHGLIGDLNPAKLKGLSQEDKITYLLPMVGLNSLSERMKASMIEVQSSICSWPQLASSVAMGGGVAAELTRKILLGESTVSGRFYVDLDEIIAEPSMPPEAEMIKRPDPLSALQIQRMAQEAMLEPKADNLNEDLKQAVLEAARLAPSGGNCQPWKFFFYEGYMLLFHDRHYSISFLDYAHAGSYVGFGAVIENVRIAAGAAGMYLHHQYFPDRKNNLLVAALWFSPGETSYTKEQVLHMLQRHTNRNFSKRVLLEPTHKEALRVLSEQITPAQLTLVEHETEMQILAELLASAEKELLLHPQGHADVFGRELRWNTQEAEATGDGIDIATLPMSKAEILALRVAGSRKAMEWIGKINGGEAFKKGTNKAIAASSAIGIISMPFFTPEAFLYGGEMMERIWIQCQALGISFQPATQYSFLMSRIKHGKGIGFNKEKIAKFNDLSLRFDSLLPQLSERTIVFIFRLAYENEPTVKALRRNLEKVYVRNYDSN
jgi:molybdopterin/thiamine biosynthesis adenylyltransferase